MEDIVIVSAARTGVGKFGGIVGFCFTSFYRCLYFYFVLYICRLQFFPGFILSFNTESEECIGSLVNGFLLFLQMFHSVPFEVFTGFIYQPS